MTILRSYQWPGNVRELKNVVERAVSLTEGDHIDVDHLPFEIRAFQSKCRQSPRTAFKPLAEELACYEKEILSEVISMNKGNMAKTARVLGVSRSTLYEKCKGHGL
jgi:DNA-binding NtrC family response regulator